MRSRARARRDPVSGRSVRRTGRAVVPATAPWNGQSRLPPARTLRSVRTWPSSSPSPPARARRDRPAQAQRLDRIPRPRSCPNIPQRRVRAAPFRTGCRRSSVPGKVYLSSPKRKEKRGENTAARRACRPAAKPWYFPKKRPCPSGSRHARTAWIHRGRDGGPARWGRPGSSCRRGGSAWQGRHRRQTGRTARRFAGLP